MSKLGTQLETDSLRFLNLPNDMKLTASDTTVTMRSTTHTHNRFPLSWRQRRPFHVMFDCQTMSLSYHPCLCQLISDHVSHYEEVFKLHDFFNIARRLYITRRFLSINRLSNGINRLINCITRLIHGSTWLVNGWRARPAPQPLINRVMPLDNQVMQLINRLKQSNHRTCKWKELKQIWNNHSTPSNTAT